MPNIEHDVSPESMARANVANYAASMVGLARAYGGEVREDPDMLWYVTGLPVAFLNGVMSFDLASESVDERIEWAIERARALGIAFSWRLGPSSRPSGLAERLVQHGLEGGGETPAMGVDLATLPEMPALPVGLTIEQVRDRDTLKRWAYTSAIGSDLPDSDASIFAEVVARDRLGDDSPAYYLATLDGVPVATSAVISAAGVAGLFAVATLEHVRGRGIGTAITLLPLLASRDLGYRIGVLQASSMGYPIYRRLGFQEHFRYRTYHREPNV